MYLVIGSEHDPCCRIVYALLHKLGHSVYLTAEPFFGKNTFTWRLNTQDSESSLCGQEYPCIDNHTWRGVLVRGYGVPVDPACWLRDHYTYICAEAQAALFAWLHTLPCPVVNRPTADLWFLPRRSTVAWQGHFIRAGLPTSAMQITNNLIDAHRFAERWEGKLTYMPLTSNSYNTITTEEQWSDLAGIMKYLPVALMGPFEGLPVFACVIGQEIFWSSDPQLPAVRMEDLGAGLHRLARLLMLDVVQVKLYTGAQGLRCININIFPQFDLYSADVQRDMGAAIVGLLGG